MTKSTLRCRPSSLRSFSRTRAIYVLTYASAVCSIATISWALVGWTDRHLAEPKILFTIAMAFTVWLAGLGWHHIQENALVLYREEARLLYVAGLFATGTTVVFTGRISRGIIDRDSNWGVTSPIMGLPAAYIVPAGLGLIIACYFLLRLTQLYELDVRNVNETVQPFSFGYLFSFALMGFVTSIAAYCTGAIFQFNEWGCILLVVLSVPCALGVMAGLKHLFSRPTLRPRPHSKPGLYSRPALVVPPEFRLSPNVLPRSNGKFLDHPVPVAKEDTFP